MRYSILFICFIFPVLVLAQTQIGQTILGEDGNVVSGYSVAMNGSGNRVVIGARYGSNTAEGTAGRFTGYAFAYEFNPADSLWRQMGDKKYGEGRDDIAGTSVAMSESGDIIAIGAPLNDDNGIDAGHVRVYAWNTSFNQWEQLGEDIDGITARDAFGQSISLSDDGLHLSVGALLNDSTATNAGAVYTYQWNGQAWDLYGVLVGEEESDQFGVNQTLSGDGNRIAIGANGDDINGENAGSVTVYEWVSNNWQRVGQPIVGKFEGSELGLGVDLSSDGNTLAVGAPIRNTFIGSRGYSQVYQYIAGNWLQIGEDIYGEENTSDYFGYRIALSGDGQSLVVGAPFNDSEGGVSGQARVYSRDVDGWRETHLINGENVDVLGFSVGISDAGDRTVLGACQFYADGLVLGPGKTKIYALSEIINSIEHEGTAGNLKIFPNPAVNRIQVEGLDKNYLSAIYNMQGIIVRRASLLGNQVNDINIVHLPPGMYYLSILSANGVILKTLPFSKLR